MKYAIRTTAALTAAAIALYACISAPTAAGTTDSIQAQNYPTDWTANPTAAVVLEPVTEEAAP